MSVRARRPVARGACQIDGLRDACGRMATRAKIAH